MPNGTYGGVRGGLNSTYSICPFSISKKEVFVCLSAVISTALVVDIFDLVIHYIEEI